MIRKLLNPLFFLHLVFVVLILVGTLPRYLVVYEAGLLAAYFLFAPIEDGIIFFVRSIPLFIAIPLTAGYDNLNMWRIFSGIIFCRWFFSAATLRWMRTEFSVAFKKPMQYMKDHKLHALFHILTLLALLSLWHAPDRVTGLKRIIYFINAAMIGVVIAHGSNREFLKRLVRNITVPVILVTLAGVIQVVSTYFIDIYQFMRIWGEGVELRLFGSQWSYIAIHVGNTWFAYFGNQLSLRVFSLFPDSHSFPIFLLLGLPAFFAWTLVAPLERAGRLRTMMHTRGKLAVLWIPLIFLMMILSGTRGIWAAGVAMNVWVIALWAYMRYKKTGQELSNTFRYISCYFIIFFMLFAVAYPIFSSPQFLVLKGDSLLMQKRLTSILDFGETSNNQRIEIWKKTAVSIAHHPILGVGIGNFPVVLGQNILLSKAGSSAHNIYLHVAAEMGLAALVVFLYMLWLVIKKIFDNFSGAASVAEKAYFSGLLITIPWVLAYLMTDVALFDERALLLFSVTLGITFAYGE